MLISYIAEMRIHVSWYADVSMGHITGDLNTSNHYFTSCSLSVCLFRSHFTVKLSPQWQWKGFCVQSNVSLQTDLPSECLPTDQHTKPFSPHCIIRCHMKYLLSVKGFLLSVKGFWHVAHLYDLSSVWLLKWRLIVLWVIKCLLYTELRWGRSLVCIVEWLVKVPFCMQCTPHVWQRCNCSPVCVLTWLSKLWHVVKAFPHTQHMCIPCVQLTMVI